MTMLSMKKPAAIAALGAIAIIGCDGTTDPSRYETGFMNIEVVAQGGDLDEDGYEIIIDSTRRVIVGSAGTAWLTNLTPGQHVLTLEGVPSNCDVTSVNPLTVKTIANQTITATFSMTCQRTGIEVRVIANGEDMPGGLGVLVGGQTKGVVSPNGNVSITRLPPGSYPVSLAVERTNCTVEGENPVSAAVTARSITIVSFSIACVIIEKQIAFVVDSVATSYHRQWIMVTDSSARGIVPLTEGSAPSWSPDGARIAYSTVECPSYYDPCTGGLAMIDPVTRSRTTVPNGERGTDPSWSRDGSMIAFYRFSDQYDGVGTINVMKVDGSPATPLATPDGVSASDPALSPDGQRIVFVCSRPGWGLCIINTDGSGFRPLTTIGLYSSPKWSPDGSRIAASSHEYSQTEIVVMDSDGANIIQLTDGWDPSWWPDGSRLTFSRGDGLFTIGADGSGLTRLTTGRHRDATFRP